AGLSKDTPIGLIRWGTRPEQEELIGELATIIEQIEKSGFEAPAIVVIGAVVKLHSVLGDGA
ncbi:MAG: uroporphyrin-III C-methyltransferase, partial [Rivularia sp. (in: cyanobacteria)]